MIIHLVISEADKYLYHHQAKKCLVLSESEKYVPCIISQRKIHPSICVTMVTHAHNMKLSIVRYHGNVHPSLCITMVTYTLHCALPRNRTPSIVRHHGNVHPPLCITMVTYTVHCADTMCGVLVLRAAVTMAELETNSEHTTLFLYSYAFGLNTTQVQVVQVGGR